MSFTLHLNEHDVPETMVVGFGFGSVVIGLGQIDKTPALGMYGTAGKHAVGDKVDETLVEPHPIVLLTFETVADIETLAASLIRLKNAYIAAQEKTDADPTEPVA